MTFLPVVERELRVASRRPRTYWRRFAAVLIGLALFAWAWVIGGGGLPQHLRAQGLFYTLAGVAFVYSLLAGAGTTADAISEEKREGTLGLLFLTDLKGFDVVAGKLAAKSLDAFYRLLAVLPLLAIPILMGGVPPGEFIRMALVLVNTLAFSLAAGMFVSALSWSSQRAAAAALGLVILITAGLPFARLLGEIGNWRVLKSDAVMLASPAYGFSLVFDAPFKLKPAHFWLCAAITHAITWLFLASASLLVRRAWQDRPAAGSSAGRREKFRLWQFGSAAERARFRSRLLDLNPFFWLAARDRRKPQYPLAFLACGAVLWCCLYLKFTDDMIDPAVFVMTAFLMHTVLKCWIGIEACRQIAEDRRTGALELLLSTPLSVPEILEGQRMALHRQFLPAGIAVLAADLLMLVAKTGDHLAGSGWLVYFLAGVAVFVADMYTLAWVGMWHGLTSKTAGRATFKSLLRVLCLPWIFYLALMTLLLVDSRMTSMGDETLPVWFWIFVTVTCDAFFLHFARRRLLEKFRLVATQRFDSGKAEGSAAAQTAGP